MELAVSASSISASLVAIGWYTGNCLAKMKQPHKVQKACLVLPRKAGKSSLVKHFLGNNPDFMLIDLDAIVKTHPDSNQDFLKKLDEAEANGDHSTHRLLSEDLYKKVYEKIKQSWLSNKKRRLLCLTSSLELAKELFKQSSIFVAMPSKKLFDELVDKEVDVRVQELMRNSRTNVISQLQPNNMFIYDKFDELYSEVQNRFKVQHKL